MDWKSEDGDHMRGHGRQHDFFPGVANYGSGNESPQGVQG